MPRKREEKLQEKIRILKERHNKWLHKKKVESASIEPESQVDSTGSYLSHDPYGSHMESFHFTPLPSSKSNDDFLSKLSNKIALQIKDELNINIQIADSHMEDYLSSELQTHNCQICFELMISPTKTPTLLFPCGHTFCKLCITQYADSHKGSGVQMKCPYCRKDIVNMAENHSLKELIEKFVGQHQHLKSFNSNSNNNSNSNSNNSNNSNSNSNAESLRFRCNSADAKMKQKFITEYKNVEVRHRILSNELDEIEKKGMDEKEKKMGISSMMKILQSEKDKVLEQISILEEQQNLIDKNLEEQCNKKKLLGQAATDRQEQIQMIQTTLRTMEREMTKTKALAEAVGASEEELQTCY